MEPAVVVRIHPGQSARRRPPRVALRVLFIAAATSSAPCPNPVAGPALAAAGELDPGSRRVATIAQADSIAIHRYARTLQARFERLRLRELPRIPGGGSHECDEIIGRLCVWDDGYDDWKPKEESAKIRAGRSELLAGLDSLGALLPGDHWIFGQRIRYLAEAGRLVAAEALGRHCTLPGEWRCDAYLGYVLHNRTDFARAEQAFRRAIAAMPEDVRRQWTAPRYVLDRELRLWHSEQPDSAAALERLWMLADPLFLTEGNDRWTGHMSRWSYSMSAEGARNPYELSWGDDFTEVVVRYGWPAGWERTWPRIGQSSYTIVGRDLPGATRTFPPREVLARGPAGEEPVAWEIPERHPRSAYLPPYLDSLGAVDGQAARFWRSGHVVVVAAWTAPDDEADAPGARRARSGDAPVLAGLFVEQGGEILGEARVVAAPGGPVRLRTSAPWADWGTVSLEAWDPEARHADRFRAGMGFRQLPPGLLAVSDLILLDAGAEPDSLEDAIGVLRTSTEVNSGEALAVALEVYGLGARGEVVRFDTWVERRGEGFLARIGRWLRLAGPREVVSVSWDEAGPRGAEPMFRTFTIGLPELTPGGYDVVVEVSAGGRPPLTARRGFAVR